MPPLHRAVLLAMLSPLVAAVGCGHIPCAVSPGCHPCGDGCRQQCGDQPPAGPSVPPAAAAPPFAAPQARLLPVPTRPVFLPGSFQPPAQVELPGPMPRQFEPRGEAPAPLQRPSSGDSSPAPADQPLRRDRLTSDESRPKPQVRPTAWVFAP